MILKNSAEVIKPKNIYLVLGREDYLKKDFIKRLKTKILQDDLAGLNLAVFYAERANAKEVIDCANTLPFISRNRLIVVKNSEKFSPEDKKLLLNYVKKPSKTSYIVFESTGSAAKDSFFSELKPYAQTEVFDKLSGEELAKWIVGVISKKGKRINSETAKFLAEILPDDLESVSSEVEKLITFLGHRPQILKQDAENIISKSAKETAFNFMELISKKSFDKALSMGMEIFNDKKRFPELIGLLGWQLKRLWKVKALLKKDYALRDIARDLNISEYIAKRLIEQSEGFTLIKLKKMLSTLLKLDKSLKSGIISSNDFLELLVAELAAIRS